MDPKDKQELVNTVKTEVERFWDQRFEGLEKEFQNLYRIVADLQNEIKDGFKEDIIKALLEAGVASDEAGRATNNLKLQQKITASERKWGVADRILDHALKATGVGGIIYLIVQMIISRMG